MYRVSSRLVGGTKQKSIPKTKTSKQTNNNNNETNAVVRDLSMATEEATNKRLTIHRTVLQLLPLRPFSKAAIEN